MQQQHVNGVQYPNELGLDTILPDEDATQFVRLRDQLFEDLAPKSAYERCLALNLVSIEWEISRHRRLLAATISDEVRSRADARTAPHNEGAASVNQDTPNSPSQRGDWPARTRNQVTASEIGARAVVGRLSAVAYHETRVADLERRRRALWQDYDRLKSKPRPADDIEDAIEVP